MKKGRGEKMKTDERENLEKLKTEERNGKEDDERKEERR